MSAPLILPAAAPTIRLLEENWGLLLPCKDPKGGAAVSEPMRCMPVTACQHGEPCLLLPAPTVMKDPGRRGLHY